MGPRRYPQRAQVPRRAGRATQQSIAVKMMLKRIAQESVKPKS